MFFPFKTQEINLFGNFLSVQLEMLQEIADSHKLVKLMTSKYLGKGIKKNNTLLNQWFNNTAISKF